MMRERLSYLAQCIRWYIAYGKKPIPQPIKKGQSECDN